VEEVHGTVGSMSAGKVSASREPFRAVSTPSLATHIQKNGSKPFFCMCVARSRATARPATRTRTTRRCRTDHHL